MKKIYQTPGFDAEALNILRTKSEKNHSEDYDETLPFGPSIEERYPNLDVDVRNYISGLESAQHDLICANFELIQENRKLKDIVAELAGIMNENK